MAEARRKKRSSPDKADVKLYERLARLLSHIKDLWNGHQSLLRVSFRYFGYSKDIATKSMPYSYLHPLHFLSSLVVAEQAGKRITRCGGHWQCV